MTSESTRKVIDHMNAANEEAKAELMILDSDNRRLTDIRERKNDEIEDLRSSNWNLAGEILRMNKDYEFTMILMILSLVFGFVSIGYAVWV